MRARITLSTLQHYYPSKEDLFRDRAIILELALGLVIFTVVGLGFLMWWMIPEMPLAVAFALAAVISPTDPIAVSAIAQRVPNHTAVLNGRFKGGYITRQYGNPAEGVHAIQLELTQSSYMEERHPFAYDPAKAANVQPAIRQMLETVLTFVEAH